MSYEDIERVVQASPADDVDEDGEQIAWRYAWTPMPAFRDAERFRDENDLLNAMEGALGERGTVWAARSGSGQRWAWRTVWTGPLGRMTPEGLRARVLAEYDAVAEWAIVWEETR
jgi:hypothetical protein